VNGGVAPVWARSEAIACGEPGPRGQRVSGHGAHGDAGLRDLQQQTERLGAHEICVEKQAGVAEKRQPEHQHPRRQAGRRHVAGRRAWY